MNELSALLPIIDLHAAELKASHPGVLAIRPGYVLENNWPTKQPAIVVVTAPNAGHVDLPAEIDGVLVQGRAATPAEALRYQQPQQYARLAAERPELEAGAFPEVDPAPSVAAAGPTLEVEAAKPSMPYTPPPNVSLAPVTGNIPLVCHASPDAGWPTLRDFLASTHTSLTVGMYDFTSAHILQAVENDLSGARRMVLTLDHPSRNATADQSDDETMARLADQLGDAFQAAWALVGSNHAIQRWIFPTAYHIKVAVRDSQSVWLSSGNWNNSNQPDMDPIGHPQPQTDQALARRSDRDWHIIIDHASLATTYEAFLTHDFEVAHGVAGGRVAPLGAEPDVTMPAAFRPEAVATWHFFPPLRIENEPVTITPLLTPDHDVYQPAILELIQKAQQKLYIQLQYIHPSDKPEDAAFNALIDAVVQKIDQHLDVRIIVSQFQNDQGWLERLQAAGVDLGHVKIQNGVHNKGFVVDSQRVALGSQNWSGDGVLRNRDASVIIDNQRAAQYYEGIFLHDWENVAKQSIA
jgi:PLD-like domain